jgi:hypothetical protein
LRQSFPVLSLFICRSIQILGFLVKLAIGKPKLVLALVVALLAVLAGMITYTGYLVIGVVAEYLGTYSVCQVSLG